MNEFEAQWNQLAPAGHSGGRLRVYPDHPLDFFIDYSLSGNREVIIEAKGVSHEINNLPCFENLEVNCNPYHGGIRIGLTLTDDQLIKSFSIMCFDLANRSKIGESVTAALSIAIDCLRNWADLFKRRGKDGLTRNEALGLWGELTTLESLLLSNMDNETLIIFSWRGPNGDQRDIGFNGFRIEVKTQLSTKAVSLRISSLEQLDDRGDHLKIVLNRISPSEEGCSLTDLVNRLDHQFEKNNLARSEFELKIELSGFNSMSSVCQEKFGLDERIIYTVNDEFPRLIPSNVPSGIASAEYTIRGPELTRFEIKWVDLIRSINEQP